MPAAQAGDESSVHQARVATRRLREALPVLAHESRCRCARSRRQRVRRMTRALGPVRELDVALSHLDELDGDRRRAGARHRARPAGHRSKSARSAAARCCGDHAVAARKAAPAAGPRRRAGRRTPGQRRRHRRGRAHRSARAPANLKAAIDRAGGIYARTGCTGAHRRQEAALRDGEPARADASRITARIASSSAAGSARPDARSTKS